MLQVCCVFAFLADGVDDLKKALHSTAKAERYRFTVQDQNGSTVTGTFQKSTPVAMRADDIEFFRRGNVLVYRNGKVWANTRTGTLSDPLPILAASAKVKAVKLPHEELVLLEKLVRNIKGGTQDDFSAELDKAGAQSLARSEDRDLARSGTVQFWFNAAGQITKYRLAIRVQGTRGNAEVDGVVTRTVTVSHVGSAKVDVPEAVKTLLEP